MCKNSSREEYNAYMRVYMLKRYHEKRKAVVERLGGKCVECGSVVDLELDHKDNDDKALSMAKRLHTAPAAVLEAEIQKLQLLCRACHSRKSVYDAGNLPARHGTSTMYVNYRCRCDSCRQAATVRSRKYKRTRRQGLNP